MHHLLPPRPHERTDRREDPPPPLDVVDDVEWLLDAGETHPDTITARLDYTSRNSLYSALKRAGRDDLIDKLKQGDVR